MKSATEDQGFQPAHLLYFALMIFLAMGCVLFQRSLPPPPSETSLDDGLDALYHGKYAKAVAYFNLAIKAASDPREANPDLMVTYINRSSAYLNLEDYDKAIADCNYVLKFHPNATSAYLNRSECYLLKGDYARALADATQAIELDPSNNSAFFHRGVIYYETGKFELAVSDFTQAIHPTMSAEHSRADNLSCAYIPLEQESPYYRRALAYEALGNHSSALSDYKQVASQDAKSIESTPKDFAPHYELAWILATCPEPELRNGSQAVIEATRACELTDWKKPYMLDTLAAAFAEAGDFARAENGELRYLQLCPLDAYERANGQGRLKLYRLHQPFHTTR